MEPVSERTRVRRRAERGRYDHEMVYAILDEALVCHVGFVVDGQPYVIPTTYARIGDQSAKLRTGPTLDSADALAIGCWAGVIPLGLATSAPEDDPNLAPGIVPPRAIAAYRRGAMR
jgi:hypothetical protein